jgi:hypothetical protein
MKKHHFMRRRRVDYSSLKAARWSRPTVLYLVVASVLVGLVATFLPALPRSMADTLGGVSIAQGKPEAVIKDGATDVCVIRTTSRLSGDESRFGPFMDTLATSARDNGITVVASGSELTLSQEFNLTQAGITPDECAIESLVTRSRGRDLVEIPKWARGLLAAAANVVVYVAITLSVMALFAFLAPEFEVVGLMVSGCLAGFASSYVGNLINEVPQQSNVTYSAAKCVVGAIQNVTLGKVSAQMMKAIRAWVGNGAMVDVTGQAVIDNLSLSESFRTAVSQDLSRVASDLGRALDTIPAPVSP